MQSKVDARASETLRYAFSAINVLTNTTYTTRHRLPRLTDSFSSILDGSDVFLTKVQLALCDENGGSVSGIHARTQDYALLMRPVHLLSKRTS